MRFLFCSLDSPGSLFPSIYLALELKRRGHEVAFAAALAKKDELAELGLPRIEREAAADGESFLVRRWADPIEIALQVKHIEHALSVFAADVLVGQQLTFGPLIVAERRKIPLAMMGYATYLWPKESGGSVTDPADRRERLVWRYSDMLGHLNRARQMFRLPPIVAPCEESPMLGDLFLLRTIPSLELDWQELPAQVHLVGDLLWEKPEAPDASLQAWLERAALSGRPLVYVHHGQFFGDPVFLAALIEAAEELDLWVAGSVGRLNKPIEELPERFFVRDHVPQERILPRAEAVVASGHSTVALGALQAGLPSLLVCSGGEQPDIGFRWGAAGLSHVLLPEEVDPARLREAIEAMMADQGLRRRALAEQKNLMEFPRETAVQLIERLAREKGKIFRRAVAEAAYASS